MGIGPRSVGAAEHCFYSYEKFAYQKAPPDVIWVLVSHEVSAWVASWRDHVTVIEPTALREEFAELAELAEWLWEKYRTKKSVTGKK